MMVDTAKNIYQNNWFYLMAGGGREGVGVVMQYVQCNLLQSQCLHLRWWILMLY